MDKWQALYTFWNSFGVPAFDEHSVPKEQKNTYPRITYEAATGTFGTIVALTASVWTRSTSWDQADLIANQIERYIKSLIGCPVIDGGRMRVYIADGPKFAEHMNDPNDDQIKRCLMNVQFEFCTD